MQLDGVVDPNDVENVPTLQFRQDVAPDDDDHVLAPQFMHAD